MQRCSGCHGTDGKSANEDAGGAADLTSPKDFKSGITEGEIYRTIHDGQGSSMPSFKADLKSGEEIWQLVNFVRNLWPEDVRPKLQSSK